MFNIFFEKYPDYVITQKAGEIELDCFKHRLPAQLIDFWGAYGFGTYMNGYLKLVNPMEFQPCFDDAYHNPNGEIVFGITAFGDCLTWTGDAIRAVYFKNGSDTIIESGDDMEWFFDMDLADEGFLRDNLNDNKYFPAKTRLGSLEFDECYGYVPLLGMGGSESIQNLQKTRIKEYLTIIAQSMGKIR